MTNTPWSKEDLKHIAQHNLECFEYDVLTKVSMWKEQKIDHRITPEENLKFIQLKRAVR